ncbi:hypothetical protein [uncultured Winogradskyella sp.]|uniref:hypothetical protein n=1 Tax=uncultured Winogradskyella sp. TaxID=395353 RepID=UPI0026053C54|nr:hypothetical protein [uncultured Winogradskyella sp.]
MKKYALLVVVFISMLTSCSLDNDNPVLLTEVLLVDSVVVPEQFIHGETYEIAITYTRPSLCYDFYDFIYEINGNERTIAVVNTVQSANERPGCLDDPQQVTVSFDFIVSGTETYLFKFYQGENDEGLDQYFLVEVPVVAAD